MLPAPLRGAFAAVVVGAAVVSCGEGPTEPAVPPPPPPGPATVTITPSTVELTAPGDTVRVSAAARDARGRTVEDAAIAWSSSDPAVATVDATGLVTAAGRGAATVSATAGTATAAAAVSVRQSARAVVCEGGYAAAYPCDGVDLVGHLSSAGLRPGGPDAGVADVWGWTDPATGTEYALVARKDGLAIIDVDDPSAPRPLAFLPSPTDPSKWRDVKVYSDHAYVVADRTDGHGIQILDLTRLRDLDAFTEVEADGRYERVSSVHNIAINEETGFAYAVGSGGGGDSCGGGLHMIDLSNPAAPAFAGCHAVEGTGWVGTGYTHDVQCVVYRGPDAEHAGREICVASNETHVAVSDVTDKDDPRVLSTASYPNVAYAHQGWFDEDQRYFYLNDELDELQGLASNSRLLVWDLTDLDDPVLAREHFGPTGATDHNLYVRDDRVYHSNYSFGIRVLDITDPGHPAEAGFFDTLPDTDEKGFRGSWSNYPYFESGIFAVSSMGEGLFILRLQR